MKILNKLSKFFEKIISDMESKSKNKEIETKYGISGSSIYANHEEVKKLAKKDLKDLKAIFDPQTEEEITKHLIFLQDQSYEIRKKIEYFQEKLNNIKKNH